MAVALGMSSYAWWHQRQAGRQSAEFWGKPSTVLVRYAPQVEFLSLRPAGADETGTILEIRGQRFLVGPSVDVTRSRGMVHARHALVDDLSFDWSATPSGRFEWDFLLRFQDGNQQLVAAIDSEQGVVCNVNGSRVLQLIPKIAAAMRKKRDEWQQLLRISS